MSNFSLSTLSMPLLMSMVLSGAALHTAQAEVKLDSQAASIFTPHMVLQCDMPVSIWGTADAGEEVSATFGAHTAKTMAGPEGKWTLTIGPLPANNEPTELTLRGKNTIVLEDVLVGEVWLCSGQSNMFWPMGKSPNYPGIAGSQADIAAAADFPTIRFNSAPAHPLCGGGWKRSTPENLAGFSATAFYFGRMLQQQLHRPVGLINRSHGGSPIQAWMPSEAARSLPLIRVYSDLFEKHKEEIESYNRKLGSEPAPPALAPPLAMARRYARPGTLFEHDIAPLIPYTFRGVIWYQGEANSDSEEDAQNYGHSLRMLVQSWRAAWNHPTLPFYFAQLPCWDKGTFWHITRHQQWLVSRDTPATGMAVTADVGDVRMLHPNSKRDVGSRLARLALARTYHQAIVAEGPTVQHVELGSAGHLKVSFVLAAGGTLQVKGATVLDIEVAGADGMFHAAQGTVMDSILDVTSTLVPSPISVRYGYRSVFQPTLFDGEGLPASPFWLSVRLESHADSK